MPNKVQTLMDLYFSPGQASRICEPVATQGQRLRPASRLGPPQSRATVEESMLPAAGARRSAYVPVTSRGGGEESGVATAASALPG